MIVVTGATGQLGRLIVAQLLARVPAAEIAVSVRDPAKAEPLGVEVRRGDYDDPASLTESFRGATRLLLVSAPAIGETAQRQHRTAIAAAASAGVGRIVYTSHQAASPASLFAPMPDHAATEDLLAASGVPWTALRNGFYASTVPMLLGAARQTGTLAVPAGGPVSWTTHADLAEAAAVILTEGGFDGPTPPLTAGEAVDLATITTATHQVVTPDEYRAGLLAHHVPEAAADMLLGLFAAAEQGEFATVDPTLAKLIGRPPTTIQEFLAQG